MLDTDGSQQPVPSQQSHIQGAPHTQLAAARLESLLGAQFVLAQSDVDSCFQELGLRDTFISDVNDVRRHPSLYTCI